MSVADASDVPETRPPTLADIAERAGVSLKTASRAVNGERYVAVETRDRVLAVAETMGFQLNAVASQLSRGVQSRAIGLITGDLANPFYSMLAKGVEREIRQRGLQLTIASSEESAQSESDLVDEFVSQRVRGLIVVSTMSAHEAYASVIAKGIPVVFADRGPVGVNADSIVIDNYAGARGAAEQLLELGHRRIAYVSHFARLQPQRERENGFADAMKDAGIADWRQFVVEGVSDIENSASAVAELLARRPRPTAIITGNNRITIGALRALTAAAPSTALIGFDDFDLADVLGVSTVSHDPTEMGRLAALQVLALQSARAQWAHQTVVPAGIVRRGSGERRPVE